MYSYPRYGRYSRVRDYFIEHIPRVLWTASVPGVPSRTIRGIAALLVLGCRQGGRIPPSRRYVWRNLPLDVGHEAHHRGQIVMVARQLKCRLPVSVTGGLWGCLTIGLPAFLPQRISPSAEGIIHFVTPALSLKKGPSSCLRFHRRTAQTADLSSPVGFCQRVSRSRRGAQSCPDSLA